MQPLIDADVLRYEIGFAAETGWQAEGFPPFDYVAELFDNRIANICAITEATQPPILYLTGKGNFRNEIAVTQKYKERPSIKPWHFYNITAYIKGKYDWIESSGMEADDLMAIEQTKRLAQYSQTFCGPPLPLSIISTRDKDLRQVPGWHYGWELGMQPQFGPLLVDVFGKLELSPDRKKLQGYGELFFWSQCLTGDKVDTVPGLEGCGPVKAFNILAGSETSTEAFERVLEAYRALHGDNAETILLEQGRLLWMTRELNEDGSPVLWKLPK
mgnify:FL=1